MRAIALSFIAILLLSCFWPVGVLAQEPEEEEPMPISVGMCSIGNALGTKTLTINDAVAIQGIVQQDVATSAEKYNLNKAALDLGLQQEAESQKIIDKYNLYFVGPDGVVEYGRVLNDRLPTDHWLVGSAIDGRVEYGGKAAEDIALCPELKIGETGGGVCVMKTGEEIDDFEIKEGGWSVLYANYSDFDETSEAASAEFGTKWISMVNSLSLHSQLQPWGYLRLGDSRFKAHSWRTTMAVNPVGASTFVIPRTFMYFSARMKTLAVFDTALQFVFIAEAMGTMLKPLAGGIKTLRRKGIGGKVAFETDDMLTAERVKLEKASRDFEDVRLGVRSMKGDDVVKIVDTDIRKPLLKAQDTSRPLATRHSETVAKVLEEGSPNDVNYFRLGRVEDAAGTPLPGQAGSWDNVAPGGNLADERYSRLVGAFEEDFLMKQTGISSGDEWAKLTTQDRAEKVAKLQSKYLQEVGPEGTNKFNQLMKKLNVEKSLMNGDISYKNQFITDVVPVGSDSIKNHQKITKYLGKLDAYDEAIAKGGDKDAIGRVIRNDLLETDGREIQKVLDEVRDNYKPSGISEFKTAWGNARTTSQKLGVIRSKSKNVFKDVITGDWIPTKGEGITAASASSLARAPFRFMTAYLKTLYNINRRIALIAYGMHLSGIIQADGYLTMSSPGITLEWDPTSTGNLFTPTSSVILLATEKDIEGLYMAGPGGYFVGKDVRGFMQSMGMEPTIAAKYSQLGQTLAFGGIMYSQYPQLITIEETPTGFTKFDRDKNKFEISIMNWDNHVFTLLEDPQSFRKVKDSHVSAMGMRTTNVDLYRHAYENENSVKDIFPLSMKLSEKLQSWGLHSSLMTAGTVLYFTPMLGASKYVFGLTLVSALSKGAFGAGEDMMTSKTTSMQDLEKCIQDDSYEGEGTFKCQERKPCELIEIKCEAEIGTRSAWLAGSGAVQMAGGQAFPPLALTLGIADYVVMEGIGDKFEGKMQITQRCMKELLSCNERSFLVVSGSTYRDPSVLKAEQEQSSELKDLPGLGDLPIEDFIEGLNLTDAVEMGQMQLNIHSEMEQASGRMKMDEIYYAHLKDATIDYLNDKLKVEFCPQDKNAAVIEGECITFDGDTLYVGGKQIVKNDLVAFKWMDETAPMVVVPNTAVTVDLSAAPPCTLVSVSKSGKPSFNPSVISKFNSLDFEELERLFGSLRDIETSGGSIYPASDYEGSLRFEMSNDDGSFTYQEEAVEIRADGKVIFLGVEHELESAVFTGGTIVKRGNFLYILPRYFRPMMTGQQWLATTKGAPLVSETGEQLEFFDEDGNLIGIDASKTRIPGGDKLGVLTRVDAWDDANGDGEIQDEERAGWRFYEDEEGNAKFDLWYNGELETYDADQIEIDEETGNIKIYEKDEEHVEANMLREIELKVDSLGRTLLSVKDGDGNILLEEALVTYLKGTGGAIQYDSDNNNYVFVNGQPVELNNEFKTNGFNAVTGVTEPPLLQPSAVTPQKLSDWEEDDSGLPAIPARPESFGGLLYFLVIILAVLAIRVYVKRIE